MKRIGIQRNHGSTWHKALAILSASVALCTLYILMLPAIAMETGPDPATPETATAEPVPSDEPEVPAAVTAEPEPSDEPEVPAVATAESAQSPATPESAVPQTFSLTGQTTDGITVTVCGAADSLPCPAEEITVQVQEVTDESVRACWEQILSEGDTAPDQQFLLDITLLQNGQEIQPIGPVTVTFTGLDTEGGAAELYHISDDAETVTDLESQQEENGEISLETDHFSVYAARVLAETNGTGFSGYIDQVLSSGGEFYLTGDAWTEWNGSEADLTITQNTTIDLNGHMLSISKQNQCFTVQEGATLTILDSQANGTTDSVTDSEQQSLYGNIATLNDNNNTSTLTYYVTTSTPKKDETGTTESLEKHEVQFSNSGKIECSQASDQAILVQDGTLKIQSGVIQNIQGEGKHALCVNSGTIEMTGGVVRGSDKTSYGAIYVGDSGILDLKGGYIVGSADSGVRSEGTVYMSGGVIAANHANNGGGIYANGGTVNISGGAVAGNCSNEKHYSGGGIYLEHGTLNLSDNGYITNNYKPVCGESNGTNTHGGGGIALKNDAVMNMSGGYVTGNFSGLAGGGIYAGFYGNSVRFNMTGGTIAANFAQNGEGGGLRVAGGTVAEIAAENGRKVYITNNMTHSTFDWGGGGIFVQEEGNLNIRNSLITANSAGGFGGGVGACPTGETLLLHEVGAAVYGNTANGDSEHMSAGGSGKNYDSTLALQNQVFMKSGYADYFCVRSDVGASSAISLVTGEMVGGGAANWTGSRDGQAITISKTGYAAAKYLFGLTASPDDDAKDAAKAAAGVIISGNSAYTHGGGIMTNGGLILGRKSENVTTSPALEIKGTKAFMVDGVEAKDGKNFNFVLKDSSDKVVGTATADAKTGNFTISPNTNYEAAGTYTYTLSEKNDGQFGVTYDLSVYTIRVTISEDNVTILGVTFTSYYVDSVTVNKEGQPEGHPGTFQVHFKNENNWNQVNMHIWNAEGLHQKTDWPGFQMEQDAQHNGWYTQEFLVSGSGSFEFLFNGGSDNLKTEDLSATYAPGQDLWVYNGTCSQEAPSDWDEGSNVGFTETKNPDESYTITFNEAAFTNSKITPLTLKLIKKDAVTQNTLSGAEFVLKNTDGEMVGESVTTQGDGVAQFANLGRNTTYWLYEQSPPANYVPAGPWILETKADGTGATLYPAQVGADGSLVKTDQTGQEIQADGQKVLEVSIPNQSWGYELPATGGPGTRLYTTGGTLLILAAGILLLYNHAKRGKEDFYLSDR